MALKLRRLAGMFTNRILQHRMCACGANVLRTGADSFKRVLGGNFNRLSLLGPPTNLPLYRVGVFVRDDTEASSARHSRHPAANEAREERIPWQLIILPIG